MRISTRWLSKYIDLPRDSQVLIDTLTFSGIEVEAVEHLSALPETVVSAKVISAEPIENTDHLKLCTVDYGADSTAQVVCGAPNCIAGMISILALPGSVLPSLTIKQAKIKGVDSFGTLCSERELGISDNHSGIINLGQDVVIRQTANDLFGLPDMILELEITPNRPDLLGYLGIARDLSASLGVPVKRPTIEEHPCTADNLAKRLSIEIVDEGACPRYTARLLTNVEVQESPVWLRSDLIKSGVKPINNVVDVTNYVMLELGHPLHAFDYDRLSTESEQTDVPRIIVRRATRGETMIALDGKTYALDPDDLVIADGKKPSALAGVIGGKESAISEATSIVIIEAATFDSSIVRKTSTKHKISTDSSYRFERGLDSESPVAASNRAVTLLMELARGELDAPLYDVYPIPCKTQYLGIRPQRFAELIGYQLSPKEIIDFLHSLGCEFVKSGDWINELSDELIKVSSLPTFDLESGSLNSEWDYSAALYFKIPPNRIDLNREVDLIEELARLKGYDTIPQKVSQSQIMDRHAYRTKRLLEDFMVGHGFYEAINHSFVDPVVLSTFRQTDSNSELLTLANPQSSNQSALRDSLLPGLLQNLAYNINHGQREIKLMELGKIYLNTGSEITEPYSMVALMTGRVVEDHWKAKGCKWDFFYLKGLCEELLSVIGIESARHSKTQHPYLNTNESTIVSLDGSILGRYGRIKSTVLESMAIDVPNLKQEVWMIELDLNQVIENSRHRNTEFRPIPRFPIVTRDLSFLIPSGIRYHDIREAVTGIDPSIIQNVTVIDQYAGDQIPTGHRSLTLRLSFCNPEKTLTELEVDQLIELVVNKLTELWQIKMR